MSLSAVAVTAALSTRWLQIGIRGWRRMAEPGFCESSIMSRYAA
jgi:hypothetical protein